MPIIHGVQFRPIENASGARNFFGEGYWHSRYTQWFGSTYEGCGFVAKTTTYEPRLGPGRGEGNMRLKADGIQPADLSPSCIKIYFRPGVALNAVGLTGPGAPALLQANIWQQFSEAIWISFMAVDRTREERLQKVAKFAMLLKEFLPSFQGPVGLETNFSCPNVSLASLALIKEIQAAYDILQCLDIPQRAKLDVTVPVEAAVEALRHPACHGVVMSNTVKFGTVKEIDCQKIFGTTISPLAQFGGGGISGWPVWPLVRRWIKQAREAGYRGHISACNGINCARAVWEAKSAGADSVQTGIVDIVRPWRKRAIIKAAYQAFGST